VTVPLAWNAIQEMAATTNLSDLDELVLLCRDEKARLYIAEAVACYRSGAYRSAIVATWIAVCYDIIDKLRELTLSGDANAQQHIEKLEQARASNDIEQSLRFERGILNLAQDQFDLITPLECMDLTRLQDDRNRCAHPSLVTLEQGFNPSAELARLHIRSAVLHLLQHQPVQGKSALERLVGEVNSEYFPRTVERAVQALSSGPLKRPRDSLVRNFLVIMLKEVLTTEIDWKREVRFIAAIGAVKQMHITNFDTTLSQTLPSVFRNIPDTLLHQGVSFLIKTADYWTALPADVQLKLEAYVESLPREEFYLVESIIGYEPLKKQATQRIRHASIEDIDSCAFMLDQVSPLVSDRLISIYLTSRITSRIDKVASSIISNAKQLSAEQVRRLLAGLKGKDELIRSNSFPSTISALRQTKILPEKEFDDLLEVNGLNRFAQDPDDIPF
jgi:hypothetical protein